MTNIINAPVPVSREMAIVAHTKLDLVAYGRQEPDGDLAGVYQSASNLSGILLRGYALPPDYEAICDESTAHHLETADPTALWAVFHRLNDGWPNPYLTEGSDTKVATTVTEVEFNNETRFVRVPGTVALFGCCGLYSEKPSEDLRLDAVDPKDPKLIRARATINLASPRGRTTIGKILFSA